MTALPFDCAQRRVCTTPFSDSTVARRARSANGSRIDGSTRVSARVTCATSRIGKNHGMAAIVGRGGRASGPAPGSAPRAGAISGASRRLERDPVALRTSIDDVEPGRLERARGPRPRGRRRSPTPASVPPGRSSSRSSGARGTRTPAIRLASTTSNPGAAARQAPSPRPKPPDDPVAAGVGERRLDRDRVGVDAERRRRTELQRGDRQDARAAADVEDAPARHDAAIRERLERRQAEAGRRDAARSRTPSPGSSASTTSSGSRRWRRQVGRMTSRRPTRRTGK